MLRQRLDSIADEDRDALATALADAMPVSVGLLSAHALKQMQRRPRLALHIYMWLLDNIERPLEHPALDEWLKSHNNACYLAALHGDAEEKRLVVDEALPLVGENPAIAHNAAALLCRLGDSDGAIDAIRAGIEAGLDAVAIAHIRDDDDLDLIRQTEAFRALVSRDAPTLPAWAEGWDVAAFAQFREDVRTTLPEPDLSEFDQGRVRSAGRVFELIELAQQCRELAPGEGHSSCTDIFTRCSL